MKIQTDLCSCHIAGETYPNAEYLARKGFYIPSGLALTEKQMDRGVSEIKKYWIKYKSK